MVTEIELVTERINDTPSSAQPIGLADVVSGTIGDPVMGVVGDRDFYSFNMAGPALVDITLTRTAGSPLEPRLQLTAQSGGYGRVLGGNADTFSRQAFVPRAGTYYVMISDDQGLDTRGGAMFTYTFTIDATTASPVAVSLPVTARSVTIPAANTLEVLSVPVVANQVLDVATVSCALDPMACVDTVVYILRPGAGGPTVLAEVDDVPGAGNTDAQASAVVVAPGMIQVLVDYYDRTADTYQVDVTSRSADAEVEPNDQLSTANPTALGLAINGAIDQVDGMGVQVGDTDVFRIDVPAATSMVVQINKTAGAAAAFKPQMFFLNAQGGAYFANLNPQRLDSIRQEVLTFSAGPHYVVVTDETSGGPTPAGGATFTYNVEVTAFTRAISTLPAFPATTSPALALDADGKVGWWQFTVPAGPAHDAFVDLDLGASGPADGVDINPFLLLLDGQERLVQAGRRAGFHGTLLGPGTFTVALMDFDSNFSTNGHTARLRALSLGTVATQPDTGTNVDQANATLLAPPARTPSTLAPNVHRWYRLALNGGDAVVATTSTADGSTVDTILTAREADGTQIVSNDDFGGGRFSQVSFTAAATADYFLEVNGYQEGETGPFVLLVRPSACGDPSPSPGDMFINEIFAQPSGANGDANGDGTFSAVQDEFVELRTVNPSPIGGIRLRDAAGTRAVAPCGQTLPPFQPVFGGCTGMTCSAVPVVNATPDQPVAGPTPAAGLDLDDARDVVMLLAPNGTIVDRMAYNNSTANVSFVRGDGMVCDVQGAPLVLHNSCPMGAPFTPGAGAQPPPPGDVCATAMDITLPFTLTGGSTAGYTNNIASPSGLGYSLVGLDRTWRVAALPAGRTLTVVATPPTGSTTDDPALLLIAGPASSCVSAPTTLAVADSGFEGDPETLVYTNNTGSAQELFVVMDSFFAPAMTFDLSVTVN